MKKKGIITFDLINEALMDSFVKLKPNTQFRNPVMFVTYLGCYFYNFDDHFRALF